MVVYDAQQYNIRGIFLLDGTYNEGGNYVIINLPISIIGESREHCIVLGGLSMEGEEDDDVNVSVEDPSVLVTVVTAVVEPSAIGVVTVVLPSVLVFVDDVDVVVLASTLVVSVVTVEANFVAKRAW